MLKRYYDKISYQISPTFFHFSIISPISNHYKISQSYVQLTLFKPLLSSKPNTRLTPPNDNSITVTGYHHVHRNCRRRRRKLSLNSYARRRILKPPPNNLIPRRLCLRQNVNTRRLRRLQSGGGSERDGVGATPLRSLALRASSVA